MYKKIGLVIWLGNGNYGTSLQAYALYKFLTGKGYTCKVIGRFDYKKFKLKGYFRLVLRIIGIQSLRERWKQKKSASTRKQTKLWKFNKEVYRKQCIDTSWQYKKMLRDIDVFCVGSDQVWNAYFNFSPFNYLDFAGNRKRISYASSIGTKDFPEQYKDEIKKLLLKFSHISLREEAGRLTVKNLTGREDVKKVLDPTFLLSSEQWHDLAEKAVFEIELPKEYMLVYLIGNRTNYASQIKNVKEKIGMKNVILIPSAENPDSEVEGAITYDSAAVSEFVYLIEHAAWICTDSFHATAISINMQRNFTEFLRFDDKDIASQNSRIYDVLNTFKLQDRLYNKAKDSWAKPIDFNNTFSILDSLRKDSSDWLLDAIEH